MRLLFANKISALNNGIEKLLRQYAVYAETRRHAERLKNTFTLQISAKYFTETFMIGVMVLST